MRTTAGARRCERVSGGRVHASGPVPLNDVSRAIEEIQYAYDHLGVRCFWARNNHFNHRNLGDRYYDPIWELLQDLDVAFGTHEFMGLNGPSEGSDRFFTLHRVAHDRASVRGDERRRVDDLQRRVRAFPAAAGARTWKRAAGGCRPGCTGSTSTSSSPGEREFPELTMSATDYFRRNCWISAECEDPFVADVIRWMGDDHIVYETDFPHPDSKYPHATDDVPRAAAGSDLRREQAQGAVGQRGRPLPVPGQSYAAAALAEAPGAVPVS